MLIPNTLMFADFIKESGHEELSAKWVLWMLDQITEADKKNLAINPAWVRAPGKFIGNTEPPIRRSNA